MQSILQIPEIQSRLGINQNAEHPTNQGYIKQMGDQPRCRASYRSQRHSADWGSTKMQSILQIKDIESRWEINQDTEHPIDHGDIEQMGDQPRCRASYRSRIYIEQIGDQPRCRASYRSWRYRVDGRSTEMQSILQIKEIQSRWEINQDAEHPRDHRDIEQTGDQQRCRTDYR